MAERITATASYLSLTVWFAIWLMASWYFSGRRFSPAVAFFGFWLCSLVLISWGQSKATYDYGMISPNAYLFLLKAGGLFGLGAISGTLLVSIGRLRGVVSSATTKASVKMKFDRLSMFCLSLGSFVLTVTDLYIEKPDFRHFVQAAASTREKLTEHGVGQTAVLAAAATCALMVVIPAIFASVLETKRVLWWYLLPFLSIALLSLVSVGKFAVIFLALCGFNTALLWSGLNGFRIRKRLVLIGGASIALIFWVTSVLRGSLDSSGESKVEAFGHLVYDYATGYIPAFGGYFEEYTSDSLSTRPSSEDYDLENPRWGNQTFAGMYRLLSYAGLSTRSASNHYEGTFNVYTVFRDLITDFGVNGALGLCFLVGLALQWIFLLGRPGNLRWLIFLSLAMVQMEFSLVYSLFGLIFYPVSLLLSPYLVRCPRRPAEIGKVGASS